MDDRWTRFKLYGEALTEAGVLLLVFYPLEFTLQRVVGSFGVKVGGGLARVGRQLLTALARF